jgi:hypothetical protein
MRGEWRPYRPPLHPLARLAVSRAYALATHASGRPRDATRAARTLAAIPPNALPALERLRLACALERHASEWREQSGAAVCRAVRDLLAECARLADLYARHARDAGLADALAQRWAHDKARRPIPLYPSATICGEK